MDKRIIPLFFLLTYLLVPAQQKADTSGMVRADLGFVGTRSAIALYFKTLDEAAPGAPPRYEALRYSTMNLLGSNAYFGPPEFGVYWKPSPGDDYELLHTFPVKSGENKHYLIWVANPGEIKNGQPPRIRFHELKISEKDFPYGSATVLNFTGLPVAGKIADTVVKNVGEAGNCVKFKGKMLPVQLYAYEKERDRVVPLYKTSLATGKNARFLIFLFPSQRPYPFLADVSLIADVAPPTSRDLDKFQYAPTD